MADPHYHDPDYRRARAWLTAHPTHCRLNLPGCTGTATTLDHQPAISLHHHVRGAGCCQYVPACWHCNTSHGGKLAHRPDTGYTWP